MLPTPRAEELATPIRIALDGCNNRWSRFSSSRSKATTTFRIAVDNYGRSSRPPIAHMLPGLPPGEAGFRTERHVDVSNNLIDSELHLARARRRSRRAISASACCKINSWCAPQGSSSGEAQEFSTEKLTALPQLEMFLGSIRTRFC